MKERKNLLFGKEKEIVRATGFALGRWDSDYDVLDKMSNDTILLPNPLFSTLRLIQLGSGVFFWWNQQTRAFHSRYVCRAALFQKQNENEPRSWNMWIRISSMKIESSIVVNEAQTRTLYVCRALLVFF